MPEPLPENNSVVNQASKRALLQLKLKPSPNPHDLYLLQLLDWWREKKVVPQKPQSPGAELLEMLDRILSRLYPPSQLMPVFEVTSEEEPSNLVQMCSQDKPVPALEIAREAWEQLDDWMMANYLYQDSPVPGDSGL